MATAKKLEDLDIANMSYADALAAIEKLQGVANSKRRDALQQIINAAVLKLREAKIPLEDALEEFKTYLAPPKKTVAKELKAYVKGTIYKDPNSDATWTGGTKGRQPPWLIAALDGVPDKAKVYAKLAVNGDLVNNG